MFLTMYGDSQYGALIFEDNFERVESQELKDEPGNEWTTSSEKTAKGHKQVDLKEGHLYIYTHAEANHATSVRHAFNFKDGSIGLRLMFDHEKESIKLNFTDMHEKSVHAGHLFNVELSTTAVKFSDLKTGVMNLKMRKAKKENKLTIEQKKGLATKNKIYPHKLETKTWYDVIATVKGDTVQCRINGKMIGEFESEGIGHESKSLIRLLVPKTVHVDDVKIWKKN